MLIRKKTSDHQPVEKESERLSVSLKEAAKMLGLSESTVHQRTLSGEIRCKRVGRRVLYPIENLKEFLRAE